MRDPIVLRAEDVTQCHHGRQVLGPCSFELRQGEVVAVVGPSGVGKTTLLRQLAGIARPSTGQVLVHGRPVTPARREVAVVFQHYALFPWRTALQNVEYPLQIAGVGRAERKDRARAALAQVGLADAADLYIDQLSGGMKQRVAVARAIVARPAVMLLDEPMSALDGLTRAALQERFRALFDEIGCAVVLVTHDLDEAVRLARRVLVMAGTPGKIVADCAVHAGAREQSVAALHRVLANHYGPGLPLDEPQEPVQRFA